MSRSLTSGCRASTGIVGGWLGRERGTGHLTFWDVFVVVRRRSGFRASVRHRDCRAPGAPERLFDPAARRRRQLGVHLPISDARRGVCWKQPGGGTAADGQYRSGANQRRAAPPAMRRGFTAHVDGAHPAEPANAGDGLREGQSGSDHRHQPAAGRRPDRRLGVGDRPLAAPPRCAALDDATETRPARTDLAATPA
jgi:hypothetical protein